MKAQQSLAVKYRPKTFEDVVGQDIVVDILQAQVNQNTHQNCYLFTGGAGTGKTTLARIFANALNNGEGQPIEIDAASNNGVDHIRALISQSNFRSIGSMYRVYILDEVHMLSTGAWNAMLKLIEEPPPSTIFIMCTTDPQKIPNTILSRVQRFNLNRISDELIVSRLRYILAQEKSTAYVQEKALVSIAQMASGGMRDAITYLDQVLAYSSVEITDATIYAVLGRVEEHVHDELLEALVLGEAPQLVWILTNDVYAGGKDLKQYLKSFINHCYDWQAYFYTKDPHLYGSTIKPQTNEVISSWGDEEFSWLAVVLRVLIKLHVDVKWESDPRALIYATFLQLASDRAARLQGRV